MIPNETLPDLATMDSEEAGEEAEAVRAGPQVPEAPEPVRVRVQIPETPEAMEDITASSPPPTRAEPTPRRTKTPVQRRLADRITAADGSALKDRRIRIGPEETGSTPPPGSRQTRASKRLSKPPNRLGVELYDISDSLVIRSSTWYANHCK